MAVNKEIHSLTKQKTIKNTSVRTNKKERYKKSLSTIRNKLKMSERSVKKDGNLSETISDMKITQRQ